MAARPATAAARNATPYSYPMAACCLVGGHRDPRYVQGSRSINVLYEIGTTRTERIRTDRIDPGLIRRLPSAGGPLVRAITGSLSWVGHSDSFTVLRARSIPGPCHGKRSSLYAGKALSAGIPPHADC